MKHDERISMENEGKLKKDLGIFAATAIGVSQMIGSGIYLAPQGLAQLSNPTASIIAIIITGLGTILLAICFAKLGEAIPVTGSAIVYTKAAFGEFPSFLVGWSYWCGCWIGNGAIILGAISYASYFAPSLATSGLLAFFVAAGIVWLYTLINIRGVKEAGRLNLALTVLKIIPLLVFIVIAIPSFNAENFSTVSAPGVSGLGVLPIAIAYTLWSFAGFEGSSINAGEVKNSNTVKRATIIGAAFVIVIYILLIVLAAGNMNQSDLAASNSPFSDIMQRVTGGRWAGGFIALGVCVSAIGCVGAWILSAGRIAYSAGAQGLFPKFFSRIHSKYHTPHIALIINGVLTTFVLMLNFASSLINVYNFLILLSTMSFLVFYAFGAASEIVLLSKKAIEFNVFNFVKNSFLGLIALIYAIYAIYGTGAEIAMYGFIFMLVGIPFYVYVKFQNNEEKQIRDNAGL